MWLIGTLSNIGKSIGYDIVAFKKGGFSCPYEATNDIFFNSDNFEPDISKDISIQCMRDPPPPPQSPLQGNLKNRVLSFVPEH